MGVGEEQREYWNTSGAERWVRHEQMFDRFVRPFGEAALRLLAVQPGEHVLDVGCGCGDSLSALARAVGPRGTVTGVDISEPMAARARERVPVATVLSGDASVQVFERRFDALYSRFGVMFFAEPVRAFRHLREQLLPGGRMAFTCWRPLAVNAWADVPMQAVRAALPQASGWAPAGPGPFSLAQREVLATLLEQVGFTSISIEPFEHEVELSTTGLADAATFALTAGPAARLLVGASDAERARALDKVGESLQVHLVGERIALGAATWLVLAK